MTSLKPAKWLSLFSGIILFVSGILYLRNPADGAVLIAKIFACTILLTGILRIVRYFTANYFNTSGFLLSGVIDILLGVFMLFNISIATMSISLMVALWVFIGGINEIVLSFDLRRHQLYNWWIGLLGGVFSTIFGLILLTNPNFSTVYVGILVAIHIFIMAIGFIAMYFALKRLENYRKF